LEPLPLQKLPLVISLNLNTSLTPTGQTPFNQQRVNFNKTSQRCDNVLSTLLTKTGQTLSDLLFPPKCVHCKADDSWLCQNCLSKISFITATVCNRCGTPPPVNHSTPQPCEQCKNNPLRHIDGIRVASFFENNPIRSAIHYLKYRGHKAIAAALGQILVDTYRRYHLSTDVIVPVPLHSSRVKERGFTNIYPIHLTR